MDYTKRAKVGKTSDFPFNGMKEVTFGDNSKALVAHQNGKWYATGSKCSHYGAPLANGALINDGRVRCPWHGACFSLATGDIEDFPGTDRLAHFEVEIEGDDVVLVYKDGEVARLTTKAPPHRCQLADKRTFLIVGMGAAGGAAVETLRESGFLGNIIVVTRERYLFYDRAKLSKLLNGKPEQLMVRNAEYYNTLSVDVRLGRTVVSLNPDTKTASLDDGSVIQYDKALLATGGVPNKYTAPGLEHGASNLHYLRTLDDANAIDVTLAGANVLLIGSSFISMEIAAQASVKAKSVTVLARGEVPFHGPLGADIGRAFLGLHEKHKVKFLANATVKNFVLHHGKVTSVVLEDGQKLSVDVVIAGVGVEVKSSTSFISSSPQIQMDKDGSIITDEFLHAGNDLYVAGDVARFPTDHGKHARIEHWGVAQNQGKTAAANILGKQVKYHHVAYFWTQQFGKSLRYAGYAPHGYDEVIFDKEENGFDPDVLKFAAFYIKRDKVVAVATLQRDPIASQCAELMHAGKMFDAKTLRSAIDAKNLASLFTL